MQCTRYYSCLFLLKLPLLNSEVLKLTCLQVFEKYSYSWMYKFNLFAVFLLHSGYLHLLTLDDCNLICLCVCNHNTAC